MPDDLSTLRSREREHMKLAKYHQSEAHQLRARIKKTIKQGRNAARLALREVEQDTNEVPHA